MEETVASTATSTAPQLITLFAALGGAFIMGLFSFVGMWLNNKSQTKQLRQTLLVNAAIESYKTSMEVGARLADTDATSLTIEPIVNYLLKLTTMSKAFEGKKLTDKDIKQALDDHTRITMMMDEDDTIVKTLKIEKTIPD
jgi:hypothetical protein